MSLLYFYLSFDGRANRFDYWIKGGLGLLGFSILFSILLSLIGGELTTISHLSNNSNSSTFSIVGILSLAFYLLLMWSSSAISIKRLHDRDKSGWWILLAFIPIIGAIWAFIELGCLAGTPGENRFDLEEYEEED